MLIDPYKESQKRALSVPASQDGNVAEVERLLQAGLVDRPGVRFGLGVYRGFGFRVSRGVGRLGFGVKGVEGFRV